VAVGVDPREQAAAHAADGIRLRPGLKIAEAGEAVADGAAAALPFDEAADGFAVLRRLRGIRIHAAAAAQGS